MYASELQKKRNYPSSLLYYFSVLEELFSFFCQLLTYFDHLVEVIITGGNILNTLQASTGFFCTKPSY